MEWLTDPQVWIALLTLTALEIVLGIDNIVFISILAGKLPASKQGKARRVGLLMAMVSRILLLLSLTWLTQLTAPFFEIFGIAISGRSIILLAGGLFLLGKSTSEIHSKLEGTEGRSSARVPSSMASVVFQIMLLDIVFSLDSVITAVGMANQIPIMVAAIVIAVLIMLYAAGPISDYVNERPTIKILALSFLLLIGVSLIGESLAFHIPKGYIYFSMAFSLFVELLNQRVRRGGAEPVRLRQAYTSKSEDKPQA
jgi:predicted tellurium resistance membrane protein TerC